MNKRIYKAVIIFLLVLSAGVIFSCSKYTELPEEEGEESMHAETESSESIPAETQIIIYQCGCGCEKGMCRCMVDGASEEANDGRVNINTASAEELMTLKGIGEAKADDIIVYREKHGGFISIEEIMNIPGIKSAVFEKIKDKIKV